MQWESFLEGNLEPLRDHLQLEKVLVDRDATRLLVCFLSDRLVAEEEYLLLRGVLQKRFGPLKVSLRV
ncbi:MAG TPA: hypothetical protein IAC36_09020, partial [Candidatus Aphodomonas merdavium]|nr:hypothetical protein [Candidatus Aphodomonas merdavium]